MKSKQREYCPAATLLFFFLTLTDKMGKLQVPDEVKTVPICLDALGHAPALKHLFIEGDGRTDHLSGYSLSFYMDTELVGVYIWKPGEKFDGQGVSPVISLEFKRSHGKADIFFVQNVFPEEENSSLMPDFLYEYREWWSFMSKVPIERTVKEFSFSLKEFESLLEHINNKSQTRALVKFLQKEWFDIFPGRICFANFDPKEMHQIMDESARFQPSP